MKCLPVRLCSSHGKPLMPSFSVLHAGLVSDILIYGSKARNRSIHGDVVVVELLPKSEWKGRTVALCENDSDDKASGESPSEPMPTGEPTLKCSSALTLYLFNENCVYSSCIM